MKLIYCHRCDSVVRLVYKERRCECGNIGGYYQDDGLNAVYWEKLKESSSPLGFTNGSFVRAYNNQPDSGMGYDFNAFIIPKECPTFKKIKYVKKKKV